MLILLFALALAASVEQKLLK
jgi:hypothetical protein